MFCLALSISYSDLTNIHYIMDNTRIPMHNETYFQYSDSTVKVVGDYNLTKN